MKIKATDGMVYLTTRDDRCYARFFIGSGMVLRFVVEDLKTTFTSYERQYDPRSREWSVSLRNRDRLVRWIRHTFADDAIQEVSGQGERQQRQEDAYR